MAEHEREKIVHVEGRGGSGGSTVAIVLVVVVAVILLFLFFGRGLIGGGSKEIKADVDVSAPASGG